MPQCNSKHLRIENFVVRNRKFVKRWSYVSTWLLRTPDPSSQKRKTALHSSWRPRSALQRQLPTWCWNILTGRDVNSAVRSRPNLTSKTFKPSWLNQTGRRNALISVRRPQACNKRISWGGIPRDLPLDELWQQEGQYGISHRHTATCSCRFEAIRRHRPYKTILYPINF